MGPSTKWQKWCNPDPNPPGAADGCGGDICLHLPPALIDHSKNDGKFILVSNPCHASLDDAKLTNEYPLYLAGSYRQG